MKTILFGLILVVVGCRNNPSTSAFPSIGQMLIAPFRGHHEEKPAEEPSKDWQGDLQKAIDQQKEKGN